MAKINKSSAPKTEQYLALASESEAFGERNDCSVKALSAACGVSYEVALAEATKQGRKPGAGLSTELILKAARALGKKVQLTFPEDFIGQYPSAHQVLKSVTTHHPDRFHSVWADGKTYLMFVRGHVLAIVNGVNHDHTRGTARRAISIYEVL